MGYEVIRFNSGGGKTATGSWVWYYWWFGKVGNKSHSGIPDLYIFGKGVAFWIEVKRKNGAHRQKQKEFIEAVKASGGHAAFISSVDEAIAYEHDIQRLRREATVSTEHERPVRLGSNGKEG